MALNRQIEEIVEPAVKALGFELYACELSLGKRHGVLRILVDSPKGITLDQCAEVSRQVSSALDVADLISSRYYLEVSSPGMDRPLIKLGHYEQALGKTAKLRTRTTHLEQRNFIGVIKSVDNGKVTLELASGDLTLELDDIEKARLVVMI